MPIDTQHPTYTSYAEKWQRIRDAFEGSDEVKKKGELYLPKLGTCQENYEYEAYKKRALYFDAVERTIQGLVGAVMRIEPLIEAPSKIQNLLSDITNTGVTVNNLISDMLREQIMLSRQGLLVDYSKEKSRPYLTPYVTEQITNWFENTIILKETYQSQTDDIYDIKYKTQYRELKLDKDKYTTFIYRQDDKQKWFIYDTITALKKGNEIDFIPFIPITSNGFNLEPVKSPIIALVDMSLSLYRTSADLEHGRHYTALPTAYATGINDPAMGDKLKVGGSGVWVLSEPLSKVGYLEFTGQGLKALEVGMEEKRSMMASLGSQLLQSPKKGIESSETVRLRQNAEAATLINAVKMVEQGLVKALTMMNEWEGGDSGSEISVKLNTDFVNSRMSAQDITALMYSWQAGAISHDTFLYNLKRGEVLDENTDIEDEKDKITVQPE